MSAAADSSPPGEYYCATCEQAFGLGGVCPNDATKLIRLSGALDPLLGRDLEGKYTLLEKLGQGGMGAVYRAEQRGLNRAVAIKVLNAQRMADSEMIKRFLREAKLASRLGHPNAVGVIDFGQTDDGMCYLVMELVTGRTLQEVFTAEGVFPPERLVRIAAQICDALECAHALQIVHRDLKPANAMLLAQGRDFVKILDFGLAKSVASAEVTAVTVTGTVLGTPAYMSPEHARGLPCDGRADLYSLGVMLYFLGSGRLPFVSNSPHELLAMHSSEPAPVMTGVPRALAQVVDRLLRKEPADRYPTAAAVREALERALAEPGAVIVEEPALRADPSASTRASANAAASRAVAPPTLLVRRTRWWIAPAIAGVLVAAGVVAYIVLARDAAPEAASELQPALATVDAGAGAGSQAPDAELAAAPAGGPTEVTDEAREPTAPRGPRATPTRKPVKPAKPTRPRPRPTRPVDGPEPKPAGSGSARGNGLPF